MRLAALVLAALCSVALCSDYVLPEQEGKYREDLVLVKDLLKEGDLEKLQELLGADYDRLMGGKKELLMWAHITHHFTRPALFIIY